MFLVSGISHRTAPLAVRERIAFTRKEIQLALAALGESVGEGVIISTCNRTEVYSMAADTQDHRARLLRFFARHRPVEELELSKHLYCYEGDEAVAHLFRVVSGLDSMMLGESQILGQVRDAYSTAVDQGIAGGPLSKLFHQALRVGKKVRRETGISRNAPSISHSAAMLAREVLGDLRCRRVMVLGAGEAGKLVARAMLVRGAAPILVVNRTLARAEALAYEMGGEAGAFDNLESFLGSVDIVVSSTDAPNFVITLDMMKKVMAERRGAPLLLVDIAVPRDVDPRVAGLNGVSLFDLDDLRTDSDAQDETQRREVVRAEEIIGEEVRGFMHWYASLEAVPVISALMEQAEALRRRELSKTLNKMPHLSEQDVERIEALSGALVRKLLHRPIIAIKEERIAAYAQLSKELFGLNGTNSHKSDCHQDGASSLRQRKESVT
jgi:glutamyl-tRNA reductase